MALKPRATVFGSPLSAHSYESPCDSASATSSPDSVQVKGSGIPIIDLARLTLSNAPAFKLDAEQTSAGLDERSNLRDRDDPFVTQSNVEYLTTGKAVFKKAAAEQKLSPTASSFTPLATNSFAEYRSITQPSKPPKVAPLDPHRFGTDFINTTLTPQSARSIFAQSQRSPLRAGLNDMYDVSKASSNSNYPVRASRSRFVPGSIEFTNTYVDPVVTRAIAITNFDRDAFKVIDAILECGILGELNQKAQFGGAVPMVCLGFFEKLDAQHVFEHLTLYYPHWSVRYMTAIEFAEKVVSSDMDSCLDDGEALIEARYTSSDARGIDLSLVQEHIIDLLRGSGELCIFERIRDPRTSAISFYAEFYDSRDAKRAALGLQGCRIMNCELSVVLNRIYDSVPFENQHRSSKGVKTPWDMNLRTPPSLNRSFSDRQASSANYSSVSRSILYGSTPTTTPTSPPYDDDYSQNYASSVDPSYEDDQHHSRGSWNLPGTIGQERDQLSYMPEHYSELSPQRRNYLARNNAPRRELREFNSYNHVDINKILRGADVRSTIMLRNIPNKLTLPELEKLVNEVSFGKYNFMYLRIDFANNCNVGYAFINFEDPFDIVEFVRYRVGRKWEVYNSEKIPEVSYATIQGQDCLIQKFRNSSVLRENPSYRPKIFYAGNHTLAGHEAPFPAPDNQSKLKRSMENAETIGLFPPRSTHKNHTDQRRNRSQFDRGTRFAEMEEARIDRLEYDQRRGHHSNGSPLRQNGRSPRPVAFQKSSGQDQVEEFPNIKDYNASGISSHFTDRLKINYPQY